MASMGNWLENGVIDLLFRGQALTLPASLHFALYTTAPSDAGGGTEVTGGSYARAAVTRSLANFAGTQSVGSTTASSGTGGVTSNNAVITFPQPDADWGTITHIGVLDAATGGNLLIHAALSAPKIVLAGDQAPIVSAGAFTFTLG